MQMLGITPAPWTPVDTLAVGRLRSLRSYVAFENEPGSARQDPNGLPLRSFHAKLGLRVESMQSPP